MSKMHEKIEKNVGLMAVLIAVVVAIGSEVTATAAPPSSRRTPGPG